MLPRSKPLLAFLIAVPIALVVVMWPLSRKRPQLVTTMGSPASSLALSQNGSMLGVMGQDGGISLWSRDNRRRLAVSSESKSVFNIPTVSLTEMNFSPDDKTLLASNLRAPNGSTLLYSWDVPTRQIKWSMVFGVKENLRQFLSSSSGKVVVERPLDMVKVFDTSSGGTPLDTKFSKFARSFPGTTIIKDTSASKSAANWPKTLALSPDGKTIALSFPNGHLEFRDATTGQIQSQTPAPQFSMYGDWKLRYSPDGRFVALFPGPQICLWDTTTKTWTTATIASTNSETSLAWAPDSRSLWTGAGSAQQWSVPRLKSLRELPVGGPVAVSGDGQTLATRSIPSNGVNGVWLWNIG